MIVNPGVHGYTKTLYHQKTLRKLSKYAQRKPTENQKNTK